MFRTRNGLLTLTFFFAFGMSWAGDFKVGVVNLAKLIAEYPGTQVAQQGLASSAQKKEKEMSGLTEELKELQKEYVANKAKYSAKQKKEKEYLIRKKSEDYEKHRNAVLSELKAQEEKVSQKVMEELKALIDQVAREEKVDMVVDVEQNLFLKDPVELTDKVMAKFKRSKDAKKK